MYLHGLGLAEVSSVLPTAGADYDFARRALGPLGGLVAGVAVFFEYAVAPATMATFIGGYIEALDPFGIASSWPVYLVTYLVFMGIHMYGVDEALKLMFGITVVAVLGVGCRSSGSFRTSTPRAASTSSRTTPWGEPDPAHRYAGAMEALVHVIRFFLAIKGAPLAAEKIADPAETCRARSS